MTGRGKTPTSRGTAPAPPSSAARTEFRDDLATVVDDPAKYRDLARTVADKPGTIDLDLARTIPGKQAGRLPDPPVLPPAPRAASPVPRRMKAVSMKTPANPNLKPVEKPERELPHIQLRAMSEISRAQIPLNLGNLAPPYDPAEARKRTVRDYLVWGSLAVIIASGVALVVWFVAT